MKGSKSNSSASSILKAMLGKRFVFQGTFAAGERERLFAMAEAQQGIPADELDASVDYLVLPNLAGSKTAQQKAKSLNAKGGHIQVIDAAAFLAVVQPTPAELLALIRLGSGSAALFAKAVSAAEQSSNRTRPPALFTFIGEKLDAVDLCDFNFAGIEFLQCSFVGTKLSNAMFPAAIDCDFSQSSGDAISFGQIDRSRFTGAHLTNLQIHGFLDGCDFTDAIIKHGEFSEHFWASAVTQRPAGTGPVMVRASLRGAHFTHVKTSAANFDATDLTGAAFITCKFQNPTFRGAVLEDASLVACDLLGADFTDAKLKGSNLAEAHLTGARFHGADLAQCNLRGATIDESALTKANNFDPACLQTGIKGPGMIELDTVADQARQLKLSFQVGEPDDHEGETLQITSYGGRNAAAHAHLFIPGLRKLLQPRPFGNTNLSRKLLQAGELFGHLPVRFQTLEVSSTKAPKAGKELRELAMNAISEAFAQPVPSKSDLAVATKAFREQAREQKEIDRERREKAQAIVEKQKHTAKQQITKQIAKEVGKVTDIATFLKALELRADQAKIGKATKMLKAERFQLFNDVTEAHLNGVVKSQTDPDLVYACRIESNGAYACCTQNLNVCGGLRGSICKHLLVLIIGLVKAGELDPSTIDAWVAKTHDVKPELNKETMGEIFIRYKGAEAGEVDWRPTETVPEDYYAL